MPLTHATIRPSTLALVRRAPAVRPATCVRLGARAIALALGVLGGCDGGDPAEPAPPTFTEIHERVLQASCVFATCHKGGPSPAGDLSLERDEAYASLVDVPSSAAAGRVRVVPGDPDASYVLEKITASAPAAGEPMPPDAPLEADRIELLRAWIEAGAADD